MTGPLSKGDLIDMDQHKIVIFRSRKSGLLSEAYDQIAAQMSQRVTVIPGYVGHKTFHHPDGESVTLGEFESLDALHVWGSHPEHRSAQMMGQQHWYESYEITICDIHSRTIFNRDEATQ